MRRGTLRLSSIISNTERFLCFIVHASDSAWEELIRAEVF